MEHRKYVIGVDFGTDSVRALIIDALTGEEMTSAVAEYKYWSQGRFCDASKNQFRQHPSDYIHGLETSIQEAVGDLPKESREKIVGIGIDTTGSTPCAVDRDGLPLALHEEFKEDPDAMFILWKDHTAIEEAEEINQASREWGGEDFTKYEGGVYSSEWYWSKILHILRKNEMVRERAYSWVEHCDWMPALLTGTEAPEKIKRSRCAAGHKAMWHKDWNGLPKEEFLTSLDPLLIGLRERLYSKTYTSDKMAGTLTSSWAKRLGLQESTAVAVGAFDAHMGAVGGGITEKTLAKIMGTSTCDMMVASYDVIGDTIIPGICGQVDGSIIPGMVGLEAGQSALGDVYAWFKDLLLWPLEILSSERFDLDEEMIERIKSRMREEILPKLTARAKVERERETGLIALDWLNGRRSPYADQNLKGAIAGLSLATTAPLFFRALIESTAYGAKAIVDQFTSYGVEIDQVIALGGIATKNDLVLQITADVFNLPIKIVESEQACALGAGMFGATAAGLYGSIHQAQQAMSSGFRHSYYPREEEAMYYEDKYREYQKMGRDMTALLKNL